MRCGRCARRMPAPSRAGSCRPPGSRRPASCAWRWPARCWLWIPPPPNAAANRRRRTRASGDGVKMPGRQRSPDTGFRPPTSWKRISTSPRALSTCVRHGLTGSLDQLRARAYLDALLGRDSSPSAAPAPCSGVHPRQSPRSSASPASGKPATSEPTPGGHAAGSSASGEPATGGPPPGEPAPGDPRTSEPTSGEPANSDSSSEARASGAPATSGPPPGEPAPGEPVTSDSSSEDPASSGPASTGSAAGKPAAGDSGSSDSGSSDSGSGELPSPGEPLPPPGVPPPPGRGAPAVPGGAADGRLAARVNLTMSLSALLGLGNGPAEVAGFGPVDPALARQLSIRAAAHPATRWCLTVTDDSGRAIGHGCMPGRRPAQVFGDPGGGPAPRPPAHSSGGPGPEAPGHPGGGVGAVKGDSADPVKWAASANRKLGARELTVKIAALAQETCDHHNQEPGYEPSRRLQHLIRARSVTCSAPGCCRPATRCDLDHTVPYEQGGLTCECGLAPLCRHHHRCKQAEGWRLEQPEPGVLVWRTPAGRTYITTPFTYPIS